MSRTRGKRLDLLIHRECPEENAIKLRFALSSASLSVSCVEHVGNSLQTRVCGMVVVRQNRKISWTRDQWNSKSYQTTELF